MKTHLSNHSSPVFLLLSDTANCFCNLLINLRIVQSRDAAVPSIPGYVKNWDVFPELVVLEKVVKKDASVLMLFLLQ